MHRVGKTVRQVLPLEQRGAIVIMSIFSPCMCFLSCNWKHFVGLSARRYMFQIPSFKMVRRMWKWVTGFLVVWRIYHCVVLFDSAVAPSLISPFGYMAYTRFAPSLWETALLCNDISHWLGTSLESALGYFSVNVPDRSVESRSYLTGVSMAQLRGQLSNMNVMFLRKTVLKTFW